MLLSDYNEYTLFDDYKKAMQRFNVTTLECFTLKCFNCHFLIEDRECMVCNIQNITIYDASLEYDHYYPHIHFPYISLALKCKYYRIRKDLMKSIINGEPMKVDKILL